MIPRVLALVPFKSFGHAKRRLRIRFGDADVEAIGRAMLADVCDALAGAPSVEEVCVVTDDPEVARVASDCGARARVRAPDPGLNRAIDEANAEAAAAGFDATLVVLGDVPLLRPADVEKLCAAGCETPVVLVPSGDGGTAALYRRPPDVVPARFGAQSLRAHLEGSRERGIEPVILDGIPEPFRTDLDTPEDALCIVRAGRSGRTVGLLRRLLGT